MHFVLGLDISSSCVGVCYLNVASGIKTDGTHIEVLDHIDLKSSAKLTNLWQKADELKKVLNKMISDYSMKPDQIIIEDAAKKFTPGRSSADTISTLLRFNGISSYVVRELFNKDPEFLGAQEARKLCSLKMQRVGKVNKPQKEQVFEAMMSSDLKHIVWPKKKSGADVEWSRDATDAYVLAKAGYIRFN